MRTAPRSLTDSAHLARPQAIRSSAPSPTRSHLCQLQLAHAARAAGLVARAARVYGNMDLRYVRTIAAVASRDAAGLCVYSFSRPRRQGHTLSATHRTDHSETIATNSRQSIERRRHTTKKCSQKSQRIMLAERVSTARTSALLAGDRPAHPSLSLRASSLQRSVTGR